LETQRPRRDLNPGQGSDSPLS